MIALTCSRSLPLSRIETGGRNRIRRCKCTTSFTSLAEPVNRTSRVIHEFPGSDTTPAQKVTIGDDSRLADLHSIAQVNSHGDRNLLEFIRSNRLPRLLPLPYLLRGTYETEYRGQTKNVPIRGLWRPATGAAERLHPARNKVRTSVDLRPR